MPHLEKLFVVQPVTDVTLTVALFFATLKIQLTAKILALGFLKKYNTSILKNILYFRTSVM